MALVVAGTYIGFFECGHGNIYWQYVAEISNDKSTSVTTVLNWFCMLAYAIISPFLVNNWLPDGKTWLFFAISSFLFYFFIIFFVKETKGKTEEQVKKLYWPKEYLI